MPGLGAIAEGNRAGAAVRVVVMGPSGAGKTTVGLALAGALGARFIDADDLHPEANVAKMRSGVPLDDVDRWPWLARVGEALAAGPAVVVACSALRRAYRDAIRATCPDAVFAELVVPYAELRRRMTAREGHYMPASLLDSQVGLLEPLVEGEERGFRIGCDAPVPRIAAEAAARLGVAQV